MSESDEIKLWCWVLGDPYERVFSVTIKRSDSVKDLKKAIKGEKQSFTGVDADSIDLYKLQLDLEDFNEDAQSIDLANGEKLKPFEEVSFYWVEAPSEVLSIILPRPAGTTISPSSSHNSDLSLNSPPPPWLVEIHRELWGKRNLLGKVFRTVTVKKDHFTELECRLDALHPKRNHDEYVFVDVIAEKSEFLREKSIGLDPDRDFVCGLVPRPVSSPCQPSSDDDVVMNDDADKVTDDNHLPNEATAIFPYTFRYLDLTVLQSKLETLRVPRLIFYRNEWDIMIDIFNKGEQGIKGSAVFSGQPGIGGHHYWYLTVTSNQRTRENMHVDLDGNVFIVDATVRPLDTQKVYNDANDVLTLVDADENVSTPRTDIFHHWQCRILVTSPPRMKADRRWLTQRVMVDAVFMMDPWSRAEFVVASLFLHSKNITLKRLQEASRICGNIPRTSHLAVVSGVALCNAKSVVKSAIVHTQALFDALIGMKLGDDCIHRAFQIRPLDKDRSWENSCVEPISDWALSEMMDALDERRPGAAYEFYCRLRGYNDGNFTLASKSFQYRLHKCLENSSNPLPPLNAVKILPLLEF